MATMISIFCMHQAVDIEPEESLVETTTSPISSVPNYIDPEFAWLLSIGEHDDYEQTWLNF